MTLLRLLPLQAMLEHIFPSDHISLADFEPGQRSWVDSVEKIRFTSLHSYCGDRIRRPRATRAQHRVPHGLGLVWARRTDQATRTRCGAADGRLTPDSPPPTRLARFDAREQRHREYRQYKKTENPEHEKTPSQADKTDQVWLEWRGGSTGPFSCSRHLRGSYVSPALGTLRSKATPQG